MAKNFIPVIRNDTNAPFASELLSLISTAQTFVDQLDRVKAKMDCMWATTDFADMETRYGIPAGQGGTVYGMVRDSQKAVQGVGTFADLLTLISRVG